MNNIAEQKTAIENGPGVSIHIKAEQTTMDLDNALEKYQAEERIKGRKITKPEAAVEVMRKGLGLEPITNG